MAGLEDEDRRKGAHPPGFVRQLKNKHVFTKLPTIFDCLVVGEPTPTVDWFHNGKRIKPGPRHKIQSCKVSTEDFCVFLVKPNLILAS